MQKLKSKITKAIVFFRFFSEANPKVFYYTKTEDVAGFETGVVDDFQPIGKTWEEVRKGQAV